MFAAGKGQNLLAALRVESFYGTGIENEDGVACKMEVVNVDVYRDGFFAE